MKSRAALGLGLAVAFGCDSGARSATWSFELEPAVLASRAVEIEATIREGGCSGSTTLFQSRFDPNQRGVAPPVLGPGTYGFAGRARDSECTWFASGCVDLQLPAAAVVVRLTSSQEVRESGCESPDGGAALDASVPVDGSIPVLVPSNIDPSLFVAEGEIELSGDRTLDTDDCESLLGAPVVVAQEDDAPELCVLRAASFIVPASANIRVVGARALVLLAARNIEIDGVLDASARGAEPGAGGGIGGTGSADAQGVAPGRTGGHNGTYDDGGGGGAGGCGGEGGRGGAGDAAAGGMGGAALDPALLVAPLRAGSGGGRGGSGESAGVGGAGGGAVQLSARGEIRVRGAILAAGGGGAGGRDGTSSDNNIGAGGGGGSGGVILIEAPVIDIAASAALWAAGGAGGGGAGCRNAGDAAPGEDGSTVERARARGGARGPSCNDFNVGSEGAESGGGDRIAGAPAADRASADGVGANGGGGGGAAGCILLRNAAGAIPETLRSSPSVAPGLRAVPAST